MSVSSFAFAWLLLAQATTPTDVVPINSRSFAIPIISIDPAQRAQIKTLTLYVSSDQGKNWSTEANSTPDQQQFHFSAPADGTYWFTVVVTDQRGVRKPNSPYETAAPNQKILVDTQPPQIKAFSAERQGEEVLVSWEIQEEYPDLASLRMEYRPGDAPASAAWVPVSVGTPLLKGETRFRAGQPGTLTVRLVLKDTAGNVGQKEATVSAPLPIQPPPVAPVPAERTSASTTLVSSVPPPAPVPAPVPPPIHREGWAPNPPPAPLPPVAGPREIAHNGGVNEVIQPVSAPGPATALSSRASNLPLPRPQIINDRQISLEYELKCGASGVRRVELWTTRDDGRSWEFLSDDPDLKSPITAMLPSEGIYGLRLVVESGAGLSKGAPQPGDLPEMRVEVDLTPPLVRLYEPQSDPYQRDALVISWNASDRNLVSRPVKLEYAEKAEGPWLPIAIDLPPIGTHSWPLPKNVAYKVYLRAVAVDAAGNHTVAETRDPVLIDLTKPEARPLRLVTVGHRPSLLPSDNMVQPAAAQSLSTPSEIPTSRPDAPVGLVPPGNP